MLCQPLVALLPSPRSLHGGSAQTVQCPHRLQHLPSTFAACDPLSSSPAPPPRRPPQEAWPAEWERELSSLRASSAYLSDVHAYVLANVLRRPLLVYGDRQVGGTRLCLQCSAWWVPLVVAPGLVPAAAARLPRCSCVG